MYLCVLNLPGVEILQRPATNWWRMRLAVTVWSWCWSSEHLSRSGCPGWTSIAGLLGISGLEQIVYTVKQWRTSKPQIQLTNKCPIMFSVLEKSNRMNSIWKTSFYFGVFDYTYTSNHYSNTLAANSILLIFATI